MKRVRWLAERKPENQKRSTSAATNLHRRAHWARCGGARPRHQNALPTTWNHVKGEIRATKETAVSTTLAGCGRAIPHLVASFSGNNSLLAFCGKHHETLYMSSCTATRGPYFIAQLLFVIMQHKPTKCTLFKLIFLFNFSIFDIYMFRTSWVHLQEDGCKRSLCLHQCM